MPRGNKTGPNGMGPMTGRALGYCAGNDQPGFTQDDAPGRGFGRGFGGGRGRGRGQGFGRGFGGGRGFGRRWDTAPAGETPDTGTTENLTREVARLRAQLQDLENRLAGSREND